MTETEHTIKLAAVQDHSQLIEDAWAPSTSDRTKTRCQNGLALFEQLKQIDDEGRTLFALAELSDEDVRDIAIYHLYHWHGQAMQHGNSAWWS